MINFKKIKENSHLQIDPRFERLPLKYLFVTSFGLNALFIAFGLLSTFLLPPEIPLFYGLPKTNEQLATSIFIILPSSISLLMTFINSIISINVESQYLKKTLAFTSIAITILNIIATYKIIFLVGSL